MSKLLAWCGLLVLLPVSLAVLQDGFLSVSELSDGGKGVRVDDEELALSRAIELRTELFLESPRIYTAEHFLSDAECEYLMKHGEPHLQQSLTIDRDTGEYKPDSVRTNQQMYVTPEDCVSDPVISRIIRRLHRFARVPLGHAEQLQIGRYRVGEKYECHFDSEVMVNIVRPATVIVYLADVPAGGETIFPLGETCGSMDRQSRCCNTSLSHTSVKQIHPKKGKAILFHTHDPDGKRNELSLHGSCPVLEGEKWLIQAWFRSTFYADSPHYNLFQQEEVDEMERDVPAEL
mmetsp:Transcript_27338/g.63743  ORF Transcript_27338/g.63743 Transcript_27338/m.63743 type:complete len:290 (+) Transcript_27338:75-944(+)